MSRLPAVILAASLAAAAPPAAAEVGSYLVFDMGTGEVIAAHEASHPWYPASVTKLMTVYVTLEAVRAGTLAMTSPVRISAQAHMQPPSRMGFVLGTTMTVETALRFLMTKSANDVAVAVAEAVGGTQAAFVAAMNETAARLGMASTTYDNPHGLPNERQVTTARDLALLMTALARDFPDHADLFAMSGVVLGPLEVPNHNALIRRFPGADGMKTGFICASGFNVAAAASRDGVRLGAVVLGGLTAEERDQRAAELLAKGFEARRTGGVVALDGFGDPADRLGFAPVSGTRPPLGSVAELAAGTGSPAELRDAVCGAARPATRYDDGTVASIDALLAERATLAAAERLAGERAAKRALVLALPRATPPAPPPPAPRRGADPSLAPDGWRPAGAVAPPRRPGPPPPPPEAARPRRLADDAMLVPASWTPAMTAPSIRPPRSPRAAVPPTATPGAGAAPAGSVAAGAPPNLPATATAPRQPAGAPAAAVATPAGAAAAPVATPPDTAPPATTADAIVPPGWVPSPARPQPNPLAAAGLRSATQPAAPPARPLTYLSDPVPPSPVIVALGGADKSRPAPLSGAIVGGGPPPVPRPRPDRPGLVGAPEALAVPASRLAAEPTGT